MVEYFSSCQLFFRSGLDVVLVQTDLVPERLAPHSNFLVLSRLYEPTCARVLLDTQLRTH